MDTLLLARLQFATTTSFHFLFVTLSLGLVVLVAAMQTVYTITGKSVYARMTKFWGTLYVINYALGIVTGLVMEFQFGMNWSGLTQAAGNVFGAPLALETLVAFFVEATFLGMWIFGWNRLPKWAHLALIWLVAVAAYVSALWILAANAFLQHPVGYAARDGVVVLTDLKALLANISLTDAFLHVASAAALAGGMFLAGISSWHLIRRTSEIDVFRRSLRWGVVAAPAGGYSIIHFGFLQEVAIERYQPMKLAVMYQDPHRLELARQAMLQRFGPGDFAPPSWIAVPYQVMMNGAFVITLTTSVCLLLLFRNWIVRLRAPLYVLLAMTPLPLVLVVMGWIVREVGRQPWAVYGLLTTEQAASPIPPALVLASYIGFTLALGALVVLDYWLIVKFARRGPRHTPLGTTVAEPARDRLMAF